MQLLVEAVYDASKISSIRRLNPANHLSTPSISGLHIIEGEAMYKIQRRHKTKRRDMEAMIEAALVTMRTALRGRWGRRGRRDLAYRFGQGHPMI